ncbi:MAG: transposase [[Clostridium] scindens]
MIAVDGSDIQIPTNLNDADSLIQTCEGRKPYNLLHLNALYDLQAHTYVDAIVQKKHASSENGALTNMVDRSGNNSGDVILIADRGMNLITASYPGKRLEISYTRIKDFQQYNSGILHGFESFPNQEEFDIDINLTVTRKQTNKIKELLKDKNHYRKIAHSKTFDYLPKTSLGKPIRQSCMQSHFALSVFQYQRMHIEVVVTNLDKKDFPSELLKQLYAERWECETSFQSLKYTIGLLHFHSKKVEHILQEIYADLSCITFPELITCM